MLRVLLVLSGVYVRPSIPRAAYPSSSKISPAAFATKAVTKSFLFLFFFNPNFFATKLISQCSSKAGDKVSRLAPAYSGVESVKKGKPSGFILKRSTGKGDNGLNGLNF